MRITGKIVGANIDFKTGKPTLSFEVNERNDFKALVDEMRDKEKLSIEVKPYRKKRSLDSNSYFWVLVDQLAAKLGRGKTEIYKEYIREIGGVSDTVCVVNSAVERFRAQWQGKGLGWFTEATESKIEGHTIVTVYYGSSTFDAAQFSRLLDMCIEDCKEQGIQVETPEEVARMKALWGE
jgi:hypothetical protein